MAEFTERSDERKIDKLFSLVSSLQVQGEKRTGQLDKLHVLMETKVTNIEKALDQHVKWEEKIRERDIKDFVSHVSATESRFTKLESDIGLLKAARSRADGAKSFVEWIIRYGWAVVIGIAATGYYYITGKAP